MELPADFLSLGRGSVRISIDDFLENCVGR